MKVLFQWFAVVGREFIVGMNDTVAMASNDMSARRTNRQLQPVPIALRAERARPRRQV